MVLCFGCLRAYEGLPLKTCRYCGSKTVPDQEDIPATKDGMGWVLMYPAGDPRGRPGG